jgi:rhodanese-related sulfurtransferase
MKEISRDNLQALMNENQDFTLIEVLPQAEYQRFHLPKAINVPWGPDFERQVSREVPDKGRTVVVYCADTQCDTSDKAAKKMDEMGYKKVHHYSEGKKGWADARHLTVEPSQAM